MRLLSKHNVETSFIVNVLEIAENKDLRNCAFGTLIELVEEPATPH